MSKKKIMIVDDESGFTRLLRLVLPTYEICEENDSNRALATALQFRPDLILLDVVMPDLDGGAVAAQIRGEPLLSRVPIVFLTAIVSENETKTDKTIGGFPFLAKPVSLESIMKCLAEHFGT